MLTWYMKVVRLLSTVVDCGPSPEVCLSIVSWVSFLIMLRRSAGKGIFSVHPSLKILYYRMLGARIGKNVVIDPRAILGECDLLNLQDDCWIDTSQIRGFRVERNGFFRLDHINIGRSVVVNTYTVVSPGAVISDGIVCGPHASSYDRPSPAAYAAYNQPVLPEPNWFLMAFVAWPMILTVWIISCSYSSL
jgi:hypothetical protein